MRIECFQQSVNCIRLKNISTLNSTFNAYGIAEHKIGSTYCFCRDNSVFDRLASLSVIFFVVLSCIYVHLSQLTIG